MQTSPDDQTLYVARLHPIIFIWPIAFSVVAVVLAVTLPVIYPFPYILLAFGLMWMLHTWIHRHFTSLIVKSNHIILKTGFFTREIVDMPMAKIERVDIRQTMVGSLFRYGSLLITGTGGSQMGIHELQDPLTPRRYIEQMLSAKRE